MRRTVRLLLPAAVVTACVAACTADHTTNATAPRRAVQTTGGQADSAVMRIAWGQKIKGWGLYPILGSGTLPTQLRDSLFGMHEQFIREQINSALYVSGTTIANMQIDQTLLNEYIAKIQSATLAGIDSGYILSVWSPPSSMLLQYTNGDSLADALVDPFVGYLTKVVLLLQASPVGLPAALSIQNEPDYYTPKYASVHYTASKWATVMKKVRGAFVFNGLGSVRLFGAEAGHYSTVEPFYGGANYKFLTQDTGQGSLDSAVRAFAVHSYGQCGIDTYASDIAAQPQWRDVWQTEFSILDTTESDLQHTLETFSSLGADLVIAPNNFWFWWLGYSADSISPNGQVLITGTAAAPRVSKRYFALKQLWLLVRPGWSVKPMMFVNDTSMHIALGTQNPCATNGHGYVDLTTFVNAANDSVVVMLVNRTQTDKTVKIGNFNSNLKFQHSWRTDSTNDMVWQTGSNVNNGFSTVVLPKRSLVLAVMYVGS